MDHVPDLHVLRTGFEATCGRCLKQSETVSSADAAQAWAELRRGGWSLYQHAPGTRRYAICPTCAASPETFEDRVTAAKKGRRWK